MAKPLPVVALDPIAQSNYETWQAAAADLARLKVVELQYRLAVIQQAPFDHEKKEGSQSIKLPDGSRLAVTMPINYSVAKDKQVVQAAIAQLYELNPAACVDLIDWEPKLSVAAYKALSEQERAIIAAIVIAKPGTPQLEVVAPKGEKA